MDLFSSTKPPDPPLPGRDYLLTLHKYLRTNLPRLAPTAPPPASFLQQSYTLLTLGLDPSSQPLSRSIKIPLTLGLADPTPTKGPVRPLTLRLPPDKLLYLLLRWQALPQNLPHVGRTDVPIAEGVPFVARGAAEREKQGQVDGDVQSVRSWVGSIRSVSLGSMGMGSMTRGWWGKQEPSEDQILLALYSIFNVLPALLIHPPFFSDRPIAELVEAGGYTQLGGVDVRVPLDVLRNLQVLELEGYDPRALLIPLSPNLRSLTVRDVQDGDDWIEELLVLDPPSSSGPTDSSSPQPRFPSLRHLSLPSVSLLSLPSLPLAHLSSLDLSHNLLNAIPSSLSSLSSLRSLNLSYNLITSVRNAPSSLGNISTLNISHNRIDCLVGLDRVLGLERVDVRSNELTEYGEVGRLAVLPNIRAVWTTGNEFNSPTASTGTAGGEGWRVGLGTTFSMEGREVVLDDAPFSWTEKRSIDALLASRGRRRPAHTRTPTQPVSARLPSDSRLNPPANASTSDTLNGAKIDPSTHLSSLALPPRNTEAGPSRSRTGTITSTSSLPQLPASPTPTASTSIAGITKKRRPRRVINLDSTEGEEIKGGSMRLPPKSVLYEEDEGPGRGGDNDGSGTANEGQERGDGAGQEGVVKVKKGRRGRVSASMFEP